MEINKDLVYHPKHYNSTGRKECWEEMLDISPVATAYFDLMSAYKYRYRAGLKDNNSAVQDLTKANNYIEHFKKVITNIELSSQDAENFTKILKALNE